MPPRNKYAAAAAAREAAEKGGGAEDGDDRNGGDASDEDMPARRTTKRARISRGRRAARGKAESEDDDADEQSGSGDDTAGGAAAAPTGPVEPVSDGSEITFELRKLNAHLTCTLCKGYLRDAHSIMECLHTFCKVCLYNYYRSRTNPDMDSDCPKCHIPLSSTDPMRNRVRSDRVLQNLVDKILPDFAAKDEQLKRELAGGGKPQAATVVDKPVEEVKPSGPSGNPFSPLPPTSTNHERLSPLMLPSAAPANPLPASLAGSSAPAAASASSAAGAGAGAGAAGAATATAAAATGAAAAAATPVPELAIELAPNAKEETPLAALPKPFVKTSMKSTVRQLRRYISKELKLQVEVELLLGVEVLGVDHTLEFIKKTRWHHSTVSHGARHLMFTYRMPRGQAVKL